MGGGGVWITLPGDGDGNGDGNGLGRYDVCLSVVQHPSINQHQHCSFMFHFDSAWVIVQTNVSYMISFHQQVAIRNVGHSSTIYVIDFQYKSRIFDNH